MRRYTKMTRWGAGVATLALIASTMTAGGALAANADDSLDSTSLNAQSGANSTNEDTDTEVNTEPGTSESVSGESGSGSSGNVSPLTGEIPGLDVSVKIGKAGSRTCGSSETPADDASCNQIASDEMSATVPVNDEVDLEVQVGNSYEAMTAATFTVVLPKGLYMTSIPGSCEAAESSLTPADPFEKVTWPITQTVNEDQVQQQTLVCAIPQNDDGIAISNGFAGHYSFPVKLGNLVPNNYKYSLEEVKLDGTTASGNDVAVTVEDLPEITAVSKLKWSLSKNGAAANPNTSTVYIDPVGTVSLSV